MNFQAIISDLKFVWSVWFVVNFFFFLVTGKEYQQKTDISKYLQFKDLLDDLAALPEETLAPIRAVVREFAKNVK